MKMLKIFAILSITFSITSNSANCQTVIKDQNRLEKLQDPNFINWISEREENELTQLKKDENFYYTTSNIEKWETYFAEWDTVKEPYLKEIFKVGQPQTNLYTHDDKQLVAQETKYNFISKDSMQTLRSIIYVYKGEEKRIPWDKDMYICLDKHGNIILDTSNLPVFVKAFEYSIETKIGMQMNWTEMDGFGRVSLRGRYIYPCIDCEKLTGVKYAVFVWNMRF